MMAASSANLPANQLNRIRPKKPLDVWSVREKLCLASAVFKIGDQNWVSVSRAIKPYADPNRPPDWFHQKNCVLQYYDMLEQLEQPKRKRSEKDARSESDPPSLQIMRKMTIERSEQLKKEVMEMQLEFKQLKSDANSIESGLWDDRLEEEWEEIKAEQRVKVEDVKVEVTDADQEGLADQVVQGQAQGRDVDENTQDSVGENVDISGVTDEQGMQSSMVTSTPVVSSSVEVSSKVPGASSHLLSSLLQSNMKTANELQQLKMEQEQETVQQQFQSGPHLVSSPHQRSLLKSFQTQDGQGIAPVTSDSNQDSLVSTMKLPSTSTATSTAPSIPMAPNIITTVKSEDVGLADGDMEDSHVDVTTEVVEETVVEEVDNASILTDSVDFQEDVVIKEEDDENPDSCPVVEGVEEEVVGMDEEPDLKAGDELEEVVVEEELKDTAPDLDVEALDSVKEELEKYSQDEDDSVLKGLSESIASGAEVDVPETSLKLEPLSPTSSISSRVSESGSKRGRSRGRPKGSRSRISSRKSYTDDERKDDVAGYKLSDADLSEEDTRDTDDILGGMPASSTGSILSESFPNSPASLSICSDTEEEKSYKQWKKSIMLVWRAASTHKFANVFANPVTNDIAPGYKSVVLRPMDLTTLKKNVETGAIRTTVEFQRDLMLMFTNAIMYNASNHNVYRMATDMYDDVMTHIEIMVQTSDAKNLRQSRRADASDKEDDGKKRRHSVDQSEGGKTKKRKTRLDESL